MLGLMNTVVKHVAPIFIVTSPITSYVDQIHSIHRTRSSAGFSLDIPLIMLVASIMKIFYWFGARFSMPLLLQACLMIGIQTLLLHVALTNRPPLNSHIPFHGAPTHSRPYDFWQWPKPRPYWTFLLYFTISLAVGQIFFGPIPAYTTLLGYLALAVEAILPVPQLLANYKRRGCKGFRLSVIINWLVGDAFKMWFFFASGSGEGGVPWAFKLCGIFQACCDLGLGAQFMYYGDGPEELGRGQAHATGAVGEKTPGMEMSAPKDGWPKSWEK